MTTSHTPGRLRYDYEPGFCGELLHDNGTTMCTFIDEPSEANARRLVACWNACEGISTEDLESAGNAFNGWKLASYAMNEAKSQRDELLEALKDARRDLAYGARQKGHDRAHAAIQKAEGKA